MTTEIKCACGDPECRTIIHIDIDNISLESPNGTLMILLDTENIQDIINALQHSLEYLREDEAQEEGMTITLRSVQLVGMAMSLNLDSDEIDLACAYAGIDPQTAEIADVYKAVCTMFPPSIISVL